MEASTRVAGGIRVSSGEYDPGNVRSFWAATRLDGLRLLCLLDVRFMMVVNSVGLRVGSLRAQKTHMRCPSKRERWVPSPDSGFLLLWHFDQLVLDRWDLE